MILELGVYLFAIGTFICGSIFLYMITIGFYLFMVDIYKGNKPLFIFMIGLLCLLFGCIIMAIISSGCI